MIASEFLKSLNDQVEFVHELNSLGDLESRLAYTEALNTYFSQNHIHSQLSEDSKQRLRRRNPLRIFDSKDKSDQLASQDAPQLGSYLSKESRAQFEELQGLLRETGIKFEVNSRLVRGLDYYNGTCFEFKKKSTTQRQQNTILAGGRYDMLASLMSGKLLTFPAVGWAAGVERLKIELFDDEPENLNHPKLQKYLSRKIKIGIVDVVQKDTPETLRTQIQTKILNLFQSSSKFLDTSKYEIQLISNPKKVDKKFERLNKVYIYINILFSDLQ